VSLPPGGVFLDGQDVTQSIRDVEVTRASKFVADSPSVRRRLMDWQRTFASDHDVVTEGRDQGTLVFPDAFRKYYLTASDEERARRRLAEYQARGEAVRWEEVLRDQRERDTRDAARAIAPMRPAADATVIDTTGLTIDQVVDRLAGDIDRHLAKP
jgi:cytidylate kinase